MPPCEKPDLPVTGARTPPMAIRMQCEPPETARATPGYPGVHPDIRSTPLREGRRNKKQTDRAPSAARDIAQGMRFEDTSWRRGWDYAAPTGRALRATVARDACAGRRTRPDLSTWIRIQRSIPMPVGRNTGPLAWEWRRGWDSNPRGTFKPPTDFESVPVWPLRYLSGDTREDRDLRAGRRPQGAAIIQQKSSPLVRIS